MDSRGNIISLEDLATLDKLSQGDRDGLIPIPNDSLKDVQGMNRRQRRVWYAQQRKALKKAAKQP
jgi:hypothetical protein